MNTEVARLKATDLDGSGITYSFRGGATTSGIFSIDPTGIVTLNQAIPTGGARRFNLNVEAKDDGRCYNCGNTIGE